MLRIILTIALACCAPVHGAPIPPGPVGSFVNNSAAPQTAQFNVSSGTVRGKLTAGEVKVTTLTVSGGIVSSFSGSGAGLTGIPWAGVIKTGSNLNEITIRDHSVLTSTGTNSHSAIDSHILSSAAVHGSTASNLGSRIVQRDASGNFSAGTITGAAFVGPVLGNATTATTAANVAGGSLGAIPYQTASGATAMLPVGPFNYVLQGKGAAAPTWTSSPTIIGANITGVPLAALNNGTLPTSIPASSITATGVTPGTFGGPTQAAQLTVGSDGRITSATQYAIPGVSSTTVMYDKSYTWTKYQNFLSSVSVGSIYGDGTNLTGVNDVVARAGVAALMVATTTLTQDLATEISNRQIADAAIGVTTGTLRTDLSAETLARSLADAAIGVTTGTLRTDLSSEISRATARENAVAISTGVNTVAISALSVSTASLQSSLSAVILSTGSLESSKANRSGDTFTGPIIGTSITASSAVFTGPTTVSSMTVNGNILSTGVITANGTGVNRLGRLEVVGSATPSGLSMGGNYSTTAGMYPKIRIFENYGSDLWGFGLSAGQLDYIVGDSGGDHVFYTSGHSERVRVKNDGRVGIATPTPDQALTVAGNISQTGVIISSGTGNNYFAGHVSIGTSANEQTLNITANTAINASGGILYLGAGGGADTVVLSPGGLGYVGFPDGKITPGGNVGIGTTAPSAKLEVAGAVQVSSATLNVSGTGAGITTTGNITAASGSFTDATSTVTFAGYVSATGGIASAQAILTSSDVVANAYYGDGSHLSGVSAGAFGAWASRTVGTSYTATTDGIVVAWINCNAYSTAGDLAVASPVATQRSAAGCFNNSDGSISVTFGSLTIPVRSGDTYLVTKSNRTGVPEAEMWWVSK